MRRAAIAAVAMVAGAGLLLTGCSPGDAATSNADPAANPAPTATSTPTPMATRTPQPTPTPQPPTPTPPPTLTETASPPPPAPPVTPTPEPPPPPPPPPPTPKTTWARGDSGAQVEAIQQKLRDLGYRPGPVDGSYGAATASAVLAFQKREGLGRDGRAGPQTLGRLDAPQGAGPRSADGPAIEVDLRRQIAFVMDGSGGVTTLNVSTGNGERYTRPPEAGGGTGVANTPVGSYSVQRRIDGWRDGPLGLMYQPMYFKGGFAVHGSHSVPAYPASHGCVRVSIADSEWVWDTIPNRAPVTLYR